MRLKAEHISYKYPGGSREAVSYTHLDVYKRQVESAEGLFLTVESAEDLLLHGKSAGRPGKTGAETGKLWTFAENMI